MNVIKRNSKTENRVNFGLDVRFLVVQEPDMLGRKCTCWEYIMTKEISQKYSLLRIYLKPKFYVCFVVNIPVIDIWKLTRSQLTRAPCIF